MPPNEDYMEDAPGKDAPMPEKTDGDGEDKHGDEATFLVNKEAYPDAKPGDMFKMRVMAVHDQEMECSVMKDEEEHEKEPMPDEAPMPEGGESAPQSMMD